MHLSRHVVLELAHMSSHSEELAPISSCSEELALLSYHSEKTSSNVVSF